MTHKKFSWIFTLVILSGIFIFCGCQNDKKNTNNDKKSINKENNSVSYVLRKTEDLSSNNYGDNAPISKRSYKKRKIQYHISLGFDVKNNQVRPTAEKIVNEITSKDPNVDEVILELYSGKDLASGGGTGDIATAIWAPQGELGNMTPEIAKNNNRENYKLSIDLKQDNLKAYLKEQKNTDKRFGLSEDKRKEIYKDLIRAGDRAIKEADEKYTIGSKKHGQATDRLTKKYRKEVYENYNLTEEEARKITTEAIKKNWPQPSFE